MSNAAPTRRALWPAMGAVVLWPVVEGLGGALVRAHPWSELLWLRYASFLVAWAVVFLRPGRAGMLRTRHPARQLLRGVLMAVASALEITSWQWGPSALARAVFWACPVLVLAGAWWLLRERPGARPVAAALLGWLGVVFVLRPGLGPWSTMASSFGAAAAFAGYILACRWLRRESLGTGLFYTGLGALLSFSLLASRSWTPVVATELPLIVALGAATLLFLALLDVALERARSAALAPLLYGVVVVEALIGAAYRRRTPGWTALAGMVVIAAGMGLGVLWQAWRRSERDLAAEGSPERSVDGVAAGAGGPAGSALKKPGGLSRRTDR